jgi:hypothetical protein
MSVIVANTTAQPVPVSIKNLDTTTDSLPIRNTNKTVILTSEYPLAVSYSTQQLNNCAVLALSVPAGAPHYDQAGFAVLTGLDAGSLYNAEFTVTFQATVTPILVFFCAHYGTVAKTPVTATGAALTVGFDHPEQVLFSESCCYSGAATLQTYRRTVRFAALATTVNFYICCASTTSLVLNVGIGGVAQT